MFDYLIVGSGLFGAVFAHEAHKRGKSCLVIDKRQHLGGNLFCQSEDSINIHTYGAHIFHTNDKNIWQYVQQFVQFNHYINSPIANYKGELYNLPFNMNTFYQLWKVQTPRDAQLMISSQIKDANIEKPRNLEEQALLMVGKDIYEKLIKGYTEKQWGQPCSQLPPFIIKRLPVRFTFDNNYFNDTFQGIPNGGYNTLINKLLDGIETKINCDFITDRYQLQQLAHKIIYTGCIDEYYDYCLGELEYRSLRFEHERLPINNYQGCAVVNFTDNETPYTRILEHKHFEFGTQDSTIITKEYPMQWRKGMECYYPINNTKNSQLYDQYKKLANTEDNIIFGGRLGEYKYYDMHQVIGSALSLIRKEFQYEE